MSDQPETTWGPDTYAEVARELAPLDRELAQDRAPSGRQPVHTVYVPADRFDADTARHWGATARTLLERHLDQPERLAELLGLDAPLASAVHRRLVAKLDQQPVEDLRVDFEDGYTPGPSREDQDAVRAAHHVADTLAQGPDGPSHLGIRAKCLEAPVRDRGLRTLDLFVTALAERGAVTERLLLTLPKVSHPTQVAVFARLCGELERALGLDEGVLRFEIQIETPRAVLGPDGAATVAALASAAQGRATALHYGTYDYSASLQVAPAHQAMDHPVADHAKAVMQLAAVVGGLWLSDGSTLAPSSEDPEELRHAWRTHYRLVRRSLSRAYHQGWDMHPSQLITRYAAVYAFYREGMPHAVSRLAGYLDSRQGGSTDEPATAKALSGFLWRGLECGALEPAEVQAEVPVDLAGLARLAGRAPDPR
ncbi:aldolase [Streptomyces sp. NPDC005438]|uniref:DUF6986 family protein n=1 Tax=Streptomyces sp. NPDC005438 TaxID=3156880 RepID=UPI0033A92FF0